MLLLDCRAERKKDQVCSKTTYDRIFAAIKKLPALKHLVVQLGIPIAYRASSALLPSLLPSPLLRLDQPSARCKDKRLTRSLVSFLRLQARMNFLEKILEADANPAIALAKKALPGFANK